MTLHSQVSGRVRRSCSAVILAGAFALSSCDTLLGPSGRTEVYVLTEVGGRPQDPALNILTMCMPAYAAQGAALYMLADSLVLEPDGTGRRVSHQRSRAADNQVTRDSNREFSYDRNEAIRHYRMGSTVVLHGESAHEELRVRRGGTLEVGGWCGPWRFEKVVPSSP